MIYPSVVINVIETGKPFIRITANDGQEIDLTFNQAGMLVGFVKGSCRRLIEAGKLPESAFPDV